MRVDEIIWTDKMRAVMADPAQIIFLAGATGCSKSLVAGHKFMDWMLNAPEGETQFYMVFDNIGTGVRNFLHNPDTFYNMFDFCREEYRSGAEGGVQFKFYGLHGQKNVYIVGADNKSSWSKILGANPSGIWIEELSVVHIDALREVMGRAISRRCKLIGTTNGGLPTQEFYTEFMNFAEVQFRESVPSVELADIKGGKDFMHYYHFNLMDDAPHMTELEKKRLNELYPPNSFYHNSKILGVRGFVEGAAYAPLMDKHIHLRRYDDVNLNHLQEMVLSVDIGSSRDVSDTSKASTVASLVGYSKNYQRVIVLECWAINSTSHDRIISECETLVEKYWVRYMGRFNKIIIDSAEAILINTWREKNKFNTITVKGAVKSHKKVITLVSRCQLKQQLLLQERLIWSSRAANSYNAHTRLILDEDGAEQDLNVQDNDMSDSLDYALTENWNKITKQEARR